MEEREEGTSLIQIFKVVFRNKIRLAVVMLCAFVVLLVGIHFGYNKNKKVYVSMYDYGIVGLESGKYIDDSKFDYRELITKNVLSKIKESNTLFSSIDVDKMYDDNSISIEFVQEYDNDRKEVTKKYFKIVAQKNMFSSDTQAKSFIEQIALYPVKKNIEIALNVKYDVNLTSYDESIILDNKVEFLTLQKEMLVEKYDKLLEVYGDCTINDKKLSERRNEIGIYFSNNSLSTLMYEIEQRGLVDTNNETYIKNLTIQKEELRREFILNKTKIAKINQQITTITKDSTLQSLQLEAYNTTINQLIIDNEDIKLKYEVINKKLNQSDPIVEDEDGQNPVSNRETTTEELNEFKAKLQDFRVKLQEFTDNYCADETGILNEKKNVYYEYHSIAKVEGGISNIKIILVSLIGAIVIGCGVNFVVDYKYLNKKENLVEE